MRSSLSARLFGTLMVVLAVVACGKKEASRCQPGECLVANACLKGDCSGPVVVVGCGCTCIAGEVDQRTCRTAPLERADAGHD